MSTKKVVQYSFLIALALIMSYVESQIPAFFAVPGMKLGLTNVVVLLALYQFGEKSALCVNLIRILIVSFLFGNGVSLWYSIAGGLLSGLVMILLKKTNRFHIVTVSICGGIAHNIGQILVAMLLLKTNAILWYLMILWITGLSSGIVIGLIGGQIVKRMSLNRIRGAL